MNDSPIWSNWALFLIAIITAGFALKSLRQIQRQTKATEIAANAARDNEGAVIKAERAWIFASVEPALGHNRAIGDNKTTIYIRVSCRNVGRGPAWITEIRAHFVILNPGEDLPSRPELRNPQFIDPQLKPIAPGYPPVTTGDQTLTAEGIQGIDLPGMAIDF
jgi:hypothetical protein